mgnify:CR=1 FL=1
MTNNEKIKRANNLHNFKHANWKNSATSGPSVTHEERKAHVQSALEHQAPPADCECCDDTVVNLPERNFIEEELETLERWAKEAEPWSLDKNQALHLLSIIVRNEEIPIEFRCKASALVKNNISEPLVATPAK